LVADGRDGLVLLGADGLARALDELRRLGLGRIDDLVPAGLGPRARVGEHAHGVGLGLAPRHLELGPRPLGPPARPRRAAPGGVAGRPPGGGAGPSPGAPWGWARAASASRLAFSAAAMAC